MDRAKIPTAPAAALTEAEQLMMDYTANQKQFADTRKDLEQAQMHSKKGERMALKELAELSTAAKHHEEELGGLKDRVSAVTSELSTLKLSRKLAEQLVDDTIKDKSQDPLALVTTFREIYAVISKQFSGFLRGKFEDGSFVDDLAALDSSTETKPQFITVVWGVETADWKVYDPRDSTDVTFGALLQDSARYCAWRWACST